MGYIKGKMMHLPINTLLQGGRFRIERVLGQGGFGITYLGVQTGLNRQVAIKEFFMKEYCERDNDTSHVSLGTSGSRETVERFRQKFVKEAQTISELENRHIVRIYDVFEEHGTAYYVMEYLPSGDLRSRIPTGGMKEAEALSYIRQIADALLFVHDRNILHLDIKPGNVLFRSTGEAVLVDFGLSKHYDKSSGKQTSSTPLGVSEGYAPTEQYENSGVSSFSPATDIYSLGATFYCLLQGSRPPKASIVLNDGLPSLPVHISSTARNAIETAMQPKRNDRPQSVESFLSLLDSSLENVDEGTVIDVVSPEPDCPVPPSPVPPTFGRKRHDRIQSIKKIKSLISEKMKRTLKSRELLWGGFIALAASVIITVSCTFIASVNNANPTALVGGILVTYTLTLIFFNLRRKFIRKWFVIYSLFSIFLSLIYCFLTFENQEYKCGYLHCGSRLYNRVGFCVIKSKSNDIYFSGSKMGSDEDVIIGVEINREKTNNEDMEDWNIKFKYYSMDYRIIGKRDFHLDSIAFRHFIFLYSKEFDGMKNYIREHDQVYISREITNC